MGEVEGKRSTYIYLRMQYCWMALTDIPRLIVIVFNLLNPVAVAAQIVSSPAVTRLQSTYQDSFQECAKSTSRMTCRTMSTIAPAIPIPITTTEWERQTAVEPARTDGAAVHYHTLTQVPLLNTRFCVVGMKKNPIVMPKMNNPLKNQNPF